MLINKICSDNETVTKITTKRDEATKQILVVSTVSPYNSLEEPPKAILKLLMVQRKILREIPDTYTSQIDLPIKKR